MAKSEPAIITLTGDNFLSVGIIGGTLYVGTLLLCQLWMRITKPAAAPAAATKK